MKKTLLLAVLMTLLPITLAYAQSGTQVIGFGTMYGVDGPFIDSTFIRGVLGDELPWVVGSARGSLTSDGHLRMTVRGIVFANDPSVPPELRGINDEAQFRGLVSCLTENGKKIGTVNITTVGFPATRSGDSNIDTFVTLPGQCVAPIIFVMSGSEDKWFAVTGAEQ